MTTERLDHGLGDMMIYFAVPLLVFGVGALAFQVGLLCLLRVLWRTRALGEGRIARGVVGKR